MKASKQDVTKVISLLKITEDLPSVSNSFKCVLKHYR